MKITSYYSNLILQELLKEACPCDVLPARLYWCENYVEKCDLSKEVLFLAIQESIRESRGIKFRPFLITFAELGKARRWHRRLKI